ncbi:MAG: S1C family serine protease [Treponema sp.]|nr:S1C family serine protease [Treponema sp.]MCL2252264.1 S1C family serine protease [Treponema sp.]
MIKPLTKLKVQRKIFFLRLIFIGLLLTLIFAGCKSTNKNDNENFTSRTTSTIRINDIKALIDDNPIAALNDIFIYKEIYSNNEKEENEDWAQLLVLEEQASKNLCAMQEKAIEEERWEDAVFFGRSIASIQVITAHTGKEAAFLLLDAKKKLSEGNILGAFLAAVSSHEMQPMDFNSAFLFLEKAVEGKQRRAAAYFLAAASSGAASSGGARNIPSALREYASGRDTFTDMIKGVATVVVDRGFRVERGLGYQNRVLGSAFFIDSTGFMITNYHVIESEVDPKYKGYSRLYIRMGDATSPRIPARVIGWDKALDLALIKTELTPEYVFSIVDRVVPRVGDQVLAIGSPVGLEKTVTSGIVSSLGRRFLQIGDVYQIDAPVNQGNSGGPVIDTEGRLVGVVFAGISQFQGLNFAVPAERLAAALPAMMKGGKASRPWLGLTLCETFSGAEIIYTSPNTQAFLHKIEESTFIKSINGKEVKAPQGRLIPYLQSEIFSCNPGELIALETIDSEGLVKRKVMMLSARPEIPLLEAVKIDKREKIAAPLFGMLLSPLQTSLFVTNFRVNRIIRGSIADELGISENDTISLSRLRITPDESYVMLDVSIKKRRMGYLETNVQLIGWLDSPDTL